MSALKLKTAVVAALVITGVAVPVWQQSQLKRVEAENAQLQTGNAQLQKQAAELATLRSEVGRLRPIAADQSALEKLRQWRAQTEPELLRLRGIGVSSPPFH